MPEREPTSASSSSLPRFALRAYFALACLALAGLVFIWPKYQTRSQRLQSNYEGRLKADEYRMRASAKVVADARSRGEEIVRLPVWPVILAGAGVAIPIVALLFALICGRPAPRRAGSEGSPPAAESPRDEGLPGEGRHVDVPQATPRSDAPDPLAAPGNAASPSNTA